MYIKLLKQSILLFNPIKQKFLPSLPNFNILTFNYNKIYNTIKYFFAMLTFSTTQ